MEAAFQRLRTYACLCWVDDTVRPAEYGPADCSPLKEGTIAGDG